MGLTRRHFAATLMDRDVALNCPGGGTVHDLEINATVLDGHGWFQCKTCGKNLFLIHLHYGLVNIWEVEPHEVKAMERERVVDPRKILEYLNRGAKRLDRT